MFGSFCWSTPGWQCLVLLGQFPDLDSSWPPSHAGFLTLAVVVWSQSQQLAPQLLSSAIGLPIKEQSLPQRSSQCVAFEVVLESSILSTKVRCHQYNVNRRHQSGVQKKEKLYSGEQFAKQGCTEVSAGNQKCSPLRQRLAGGRRGDVL